VFSPCVTFRNLFIYSIIDTCPADKSFTRKIVLRVAGVFVNRSSGIFCELYAACAWNASRLPSRMLTLPTPPALRSQAVDRLAARRSEVQASGCVTDSHSIRECQCILRPAPCSCCGQRRTFRTCCRYRCDHLPERGCHESLSQFPDPWPP